jgi:glycine/D-amino acid oxidase-like deaminating enzyme
MALRVAIVGGGIAGLSLAWALVKRGHAVDLFEQGPLPNPVSSSFDEHRITRHAYGALAGYGALMPAAFRTYERLFVDLGRRHLSDTPLTIVSRLEDNGFLDGTRSDLDQLGIGHRAIAVSDWASRLPVLNLDGVRDVLETDGAGVLFASRIVTDLVNWLSEQPGVRLYPSTPVTAIDADAGRVTTIDGSYAADLVVVAAGAWVDRLLPQLAGQLVPSRQAVLYLAPPPDLAEAWGRASVIVDQGAEHGAYILPPRQGTRLKIGDHAFTRLGHGSDDRVPRPEDTRVVEAAAAAIFRDFERYRRLEAKVCYYTVTEDERFVVSPIGSAGYVLSACSGHGFKLGPLIASGLAAVISGEADARLLPGWAAGRGAADAIAV